MDPCPRPHYVKYKDKCAAKRSQSAFSSVCFGLTDDTDLGWTAPSVWGRQTHACQTAELSVWTPGPVSWTPGRSGSSLPERRWSTPRSTSRWEKNQHFCTTQNNKLWPHVKIWVAFASPVVPWQDICSPPCRRSPVYRGDPGPAARSSSSAAAPSGPPPVVLSIKQQTCVSKKSKASTSEFLKDDFVLMFIVLHLELLEERAVPGPLHQPKQRLVGHFAHYAERIEAIVFATVGLLSLQACDHLGAELALILLPFQELLQEVSRSSSRRRRGFWVLEGNVGERSGRARCGSGGRCRRALWCEWTVCCCLGWIACRCWGVA